MLDTWAMKKKVSGTYRARLNAQGFEQVDGRLICYSLLCTRYAIRDESIGINGIESKETYDS
jgi:hypothetical protein